MNNGIVIIKKGREKPILQQHPWIFSGAIDSVEGDPTPGDIVTVTARDGRFLARGYWNPKSQIQVRILTWDDEEIDEAWWRRMLERAIFSRIYQRWSWEPFPQPLAIRLVNAENDFLPGLIADFYGGWIVIQALTFHIDQKKAFLAELLADILNKTQTVPIVKGVYERSDVDVRHKEGLSNSVGTLWGEAPPELLEIHHIRRFYVDIYKGHKTGFYLDQAYNYGFLTDLARSAEGLGFHVLNLFCYTGGFGVAVGASAKNWHIVNVDASLDALHLAEKNFILNEIPLDDVEFIQADVFELLRDYAAENKQFDVVILDPPKFAHNAGQVEKASRGYKDINLNAFKCVKPGGYLMTFSCSGAISADLFQKIVFGALADSGRQAQILKHLGPGDDHPVALTFPEGAYLKGLLLRVY